MTFLYWWFELVSVFEPDNNITPEYIHLIKRKVAFFYEE